ncbi:hypothetical protein FSC05_05000 [Acinetobacter indicus]|uniref:hypothetical protein n=1 Tax=Acinetobacter indicus TaxID=756892 RepID=UPI000CEBC7A5|nr:hypothetical protein [Acinetobacter indicus]MCO8108598.1 hypothetical protein [Acinetobacter indicus]NOJ66867.1 hypothetical protein [Acinetobacter indicus]QIC73096.1 hypothetical protein FSC05_05000 [Acinetobacter indicus]
MQKFIILFAFCLFAVLSLGFIVYQFLSNMPSVEYWIMLLIPAFAVPILTALIVYQEPNHP